MMKLKKTNEKNNKIKKHYCGEQLYKVRQSKNLFFFKKKKEVNCSLIITSGLWPPFSVNDHVPRTQNSNLQGIVA